MRAALVVVAVFAAGCATTIEERVVESRMQGAVALLRDEGNALEQIGEGVFSFKFGWYRNLVLVSGEEVAVFDPISNEAATALATELAAKLPGKRVTLMGYSHAHHDHIRGGRLLGATRVLAHRNAAADLALVPDPDVLMPTELVDGDAVIDWAGRRIELLHLPRSHSTSYLAVWLPEQRVLYAPDLTAKKGGLAFDNDNFLPGVIQGTRRLLALRPSLVVPGHYGLCTHEDLQNNHDLLVGVRAIVAEELRQQGGYDVTRWDPAAFTRLRRRLNEKYGHVQGFEEASLFNTYYLLLGYVGGF